MDSDIEEKVDEVKEEEENAPVEPSRSMIYVGRVASVLTLAKIALYLLIVVPLWLNFDSSKISVNGLFYMLTLCCFTVAFLCSVLRRVPGKFMKKFLGPRKEFGIVEGLVLITLLDYVINQECLVNYSYFSTLWYTFIAETFALVYSSKGSLLDSSLIVGGIYCFRLVLFLYLCLEL